MLGQLPDMAWTPPTAKDLAADWIASRRSDSIDESNYGADFLLMDSPLEAPDLTWETILLVVRAYPEADFYCEAPTEAQAVCGSLAAGPVEDLLSFHGPDFIDRFEREARSDRRMAWVLGGAWQFQMTDEIWNRVRRAADYSYWTRTVT
ncbi:DUF6869 domain-containing protein [Phreatobacter sp. HK31-P]